MHEEAVASRCPGQRAAACMVEAMTCCSKGDELVEEEGLIRAMRATLDGEETQAVTLEHVKVLPRKIEHAT